MLGNDQARGGEVANNNGTKLKNEVNFSFTISVAAKLSPCTGCIVYMKEERCMNARSLTFALGVTIKTWSPVGQRIGSPNLKFSNYWSYDCTTSPISLYLIQSAIITCLSYPLGSAWLGNSVRRAGPSLNLFTSE